MLDVGRQAGDAALREQLRDVGQQLERLEDVAGHHRDVHVELERTVAAAPRDRGVVADHLRGHLRNCFGENGIHLAGHDRATRLQVGQLNLGQAGQRARAHPADVVGDLGQRHGDGAQRTGRLDEAVARGLGLEGVCRRAQFAQAGGGNQRFDDLGAEAVGSVEAGAHRGAADRQLTEPRQRGAHPLDAGLDLAGVPAEFLAERHGHGVHQVGAARLDHSVPFAGLARQRVMQHLERRDEVAHGGFGGRDVGRGGEGVIRRLRHVDVVVRVHRDAVGRGDAGDHLVGVHVGAGARTGLEDVDRKLVVVAAVGDFGGRGDDRVGLLRGQQPEVLVDLRARALQQAQGADLGALQPAARDRKVLDRALGLRAPQRFCGDADLAHGVVLDAVLGVIRGHRVLASSFFDLAVRAGDRRQNCRR